jgi:glycosyltransferase involved in cell wall biosynthesis
MKISGFTFIRNAVKYDYPVTESIRSILPVCDEVVVAVGNSDDGTRSLIESIGSPKIRIIDTVWDETLREGGAVLAVETNKAMDAISSDATWVFYIQGDEVIHEKSLEPLMDAMDRWKDHTEVEGLLLNYLHFYGSYDYIGDSRQWYRNEVRIIRNDSNIRSYKDAQGFRKNGKPLRVKPSGATMHHYGWVKPPESQRTKLRYFHTLWHDPEWLEKNRERIEGFDYSQIDSLALFTGTHPAVMKERIAKKNWKFDFDPSLRKSSPKVRFLHFIEKCTGYRIGEYRNYRLI